MPKRIFCEVCLDGLGRNIASVAVPDGTSSKYQFLCVSEWARLVSEWDFQ
jgi:hypothetical protein